MTIIIRIATDNEAFQPDPSIEVHRLVQIVADRISEGGVSYTKGYLRDINGNRVGSVTITGK